MSGYLRSLTFMAIGGLSVACSSGPFAGANPTAPAGATSTSANDASASALGNASHGLVLTPVIGVGTGIVNVTANARVGDFVANTQDAVHVRGVAPDTLLFVRVAVDVGLPGGEQADGICQRANLGQFGPLALYPGGPPATIETTPGGTGTVHVVFGATSPFISDGSSLDLMFRIVDALPPAVPTIDLRTECFTIEIK